MYRIDLQDVSMPDMFNTRSNVRNKIINTKGSRISVTRKLVGRQTAADCNYFMY